MKEFLRRESERKSEWNVLIRFAVPDFFLLNIQGVYFHLKVFFSHSNVMQRNIEKIVIFRVRRVLA